MLRRHEMQRALNRNWRLTLVRRCIMVLFAVAVAACASARASATDANRQAPGLGDPIEGAARRLARSFKSIECWRTERYSREAWSVLLRSAREVQLTREEVVLRAMEIAMSDGVRPVGDPSTKGLLLNRVVFDLTERSNTIRPLLHPSWGRTENADGTVNLAWPISFRSDEPRLLGPCRGYDGRYSPADEHAALLRRYPFRDLAPFLRRMAPGRT